MTPVWRRVLLPLFAVFLTACQLDVVVDVVVDPDGTGEITVVVTADEEILAAVPTLADDLVLDDVVAAGWAVDGPTPTDEGGLTITLTHDFLSAGEATNLLESLGPPFNDLQVGHGVVGDTTTTRLTGRLALVDGFGSFADDELIAAVGAQPFADDIAASGATPESSMTVTIRAQIPGDINREVTNASRTDGGVLVWDVPLTGDVTQWQAESTQAPGEGERWARPLSIAALIALIAWVGFMTLFITFVVIARWRRSRRLA